MPARVIEISETHQRRHVFGLVDGKQCPTGSLYVTLSCCWGKKPADRVLRLLHSTNGKLGEKQPVSLGLSLRPFGMRRRLRNDSEPVTSGLTDCVYSKIPSMIGAGRLLPCTMFTEMRCLVSQHSAPRTPTKDAFSMAILPKPGQLLCRCFC